QSIPGVAMAATITTIPAGGTASSLPTRTVLIPDTVPKLSLVIQWNGGGPLAKLTWEVHDTSRGGVLEQGERNPDPPPGPNDPPPSPTSPPPKLQGSVSVDLVVDHVYTFRVHVGGAGFPVAATCVVTTERPLSPQDLRGNQVWAEVEAGLMAFGQL